MDDKEKNHSGHRTLSSWVGESVYFGTFWFWIWAVEGSLLDFCVGFDLNCQENARKWWRHTPHFTFKIYSESMWKSSFGRPNLSVWMRSAKCPRDKKKPPFRCPRQRVHHCVPKPNATADHSSYSEVCRCHQVDFIYIYIRYFDKFQICSTCSSWHVFHQPRVTCSVAFSIWHVFRHVHVKAMYDVFIWHVFHYPHVTRSMTVLITLLIKPVLWHLMSFIAWHVHLTCVLAGTLESP